MDWLQAIILGIVQGLTEFLPISSSAHLVLVPYVLGWQLPEEEAFIFNILVQDATLLAVIAYYWTDLLAIARAWLTGIFTRRPFEDPQARLGWLLIVATLPAVVFGALFKGAVEAVFASPLTTAMFLLLTAALLLLAERLGRRAHSSSDLTWVDAVVIGLFQAAAIFPGVSRSGSSIAGGMLRGLQRAEAARFSFLMSVPVMVGAGLLATLDLIEIPGWTSLLPVFLPGFIAAAVVGYLSIRWLISFLTHRPLTVFVVYCTVLAVIIIVLNLL